jgi:hypothetical protein
MEYTLTVDGEILDSSNDAGPLQFLIAPTAHLWRNFGETRHQNHLTHGETPAWNRWDIIYKILCHAVPKWGIIYAQDIFWPYIIEGGCQVIQFCPHYLLSLVPLECRSEGKRKHAKHGGILGRGRKNITSRSVDVKPEHCVCVTCSELIAFARMGGLVTSSHMEESTSSQHYDLYRCISMKW